MRSPRQWSVTTALIVAGALFLEFFDGNVLITALPAMGVDFGVTSTDIGLAITLYLGAAAIGVPLAARLADRVGEKPVFLASIVLFALASVGSAVSVSVEMLMAFRLLQGTAGAMLVPVGRSIVLRGSAEAARIRLVAYLTWPALLAPLLAPLVGGFLTEFVSWRAIFLLNIPICLVLFIAAKIAIPARPPQGVGRFDTIGWALFALAVASLIVTMELAGMDGYLIATSVVAAAAAMLVTGFVWWLRRAKNPLWNVGVFRRPTFSVSNVGGIVYRTAVFSGPFLIILLLQVGYGWSPVEAGVAITWLFLGNLMIKFVVTALLNRFGFLPMIWVATLTVAATFVAIALWADQLPYPLFVALLFVSGVSRSLGLSNYSTLQYADIDTNQMSTANSVVSVWGQLAAGFAVAASVLIVRLVDSFGPFLGGAGGAGAALGYQVALIVMAGLIALSLIDTRRLPPGPGDNLRTLKIRT